MDDQMDSVVPLPERHHSMAAVVAGTLSVTAHIALLFYLWGMPIRMGPSEMVAASMEQDVEFFVVRDKPDRTKISDRPPLLDRSGPGREALPDPGRARSDEHLALPPSGDPMSDRPNLMVPKTAGPGRPRVPRQEILAIEERIATDAVGRPRRREIPKLERDPWAPDITPALDPEAISRAGRLSSGRSGTRREGGWSPETGPSFSRPSSAGSTVAPSPELGEKFLGEKPSRVTRFSPIENVLTVSAERYVSSRDPKSAYLKIIVNRKGEDVLPVLPKDVIFIQDCSASMSEQRLYFCRNGLREGLKVLGQKDRFNVVRFRDKQEICFSQWVSPTPENLRTANAFIDGMKAEGNTDILGSFKKLLAVKRSKDRPIVALVISDGLPTSGQIDNTRIIGEFTKVNGGAISVFTMGTMRLANSYLLDLVSYCNRGNTFIVSSGRWDISEAIQNRVQALSRPVLSNLGFRFAENSRCEVYPVDTMNLYLDQPLVLYGKCPVDQKRVVFQAVGRAGKRACDMIFTVDVAGASNGDADVRTEWARQKIYHLIGQFARRATPTLRREIRDTSRAYGIRIPHEGRF